MESFNDVFSLVKDMCKKDLTDVSFKCWIQPLEILRIEGDTAVIEVPNAYHKGLIEQHYLEIIKNAFLEVMGFPINLELRDKTEQPSDPMPEEEEDTLNRVLDYMQTQQEELDRSYQKANYEYTFDTFIVGNSNDFAYAACKAVSHKEASAYNPLFIYGPSGLGKTHLLCAIQHEFSKQNPGSNIIYVNSETFTNELITAMQHKSVENFREKYRKADILLMDDIQFIAGKERMQEEFFHTFNELHQIGKQIVITSDRPPKEIKTLESRLKSRFEGGLLTDISMPDFETRSAIIRRKAELLNIGMPDDVVELIATKLKSNIRQLEGAVKKIKAYKYLAGSDPSVSVAQNVIREILNDDQPTPITVERIIEEVAKTYNVTPEDIRSKKKSSPISVARQVSIYIVREITQMSQEAIGDEFGGRDHATVVYSLQKVKKTIDKDEHTKSIVDDIIKNIRNK